MVSRDVLVKVGAGIAIVIVLALVVVGGLVATGGFAAPTVESTTYEWGEVTEDTTEIRTMVTVENPNPVGIPGIVDIGYAAQLNDVTLAEGQESGVGFGTGKSEVELAIAMENERIADWWVTHVNDGEQSEMSIDASVSAPGFEREIPAKSSTIETDILGGFTEEGERQVDARGEPLLVIENQQAEWGVADGEETPITFSADMENVHEYDVTLDGVEYVVTMNGVELGRGQRSDGIDVAPGESGTIETTVALDSPKMADWWAEHVTDGEESRMTVEMYGYVEEDGERKRVPLRVFESSLLLETDMLGDGTTSTEPVETPSENASFRDPEVTETEREWGEVTDDTTEIRTDASLRTPEDEEVIDVMTIDVRQETIINGIEVASGTSTVEDLQAGSDTVTIVAEKENSRVPEWWARHLNNGEQSTTVTRPTATVDVLATEFDENLSTRESGFETDLLAGMNGERDETVTIDGRETLTVTRVESSWGRATPETAPIDTTTTIRNELGRPLTVDAVHYTVTTNGIELADRTEQVGQTIAGDTTDTVDVRMRLDNSRMDEWWVTHVPEEESTFVVDVEATVSAGGSTERVELDSIGQESNIETDILNQEGDGG